MSVVPADHVTGWSVEDLPDLPEDGRRYELVDGSLLVTPRASQQHQELAQALRDLLQAHAPQGWRARVEYRLPFSADTLRVPDVMVFAWPLARPRTDPRPLGPADVALVVEVVSPSTRRTDRFAKPGEYADAGIGLFWRLETEPALVLHPLVLEDGVYRPQPTVMDRGEVPWPWGGLEVSVPLLGR